MKRHSLSLCAWAYNEEELIEEFVEKSTRDLSRVSDDFEIIIVDDASTDSTWQKLCALKEKYPHLVSVRHDRNMDVGYGFRSTVPLAKKEVIFWNTIDMFHDTAELPKFLEHLDRFDVVQGVRSDLRANAASRKLTTVVNYFLIRFLFGVPMSEFQNVKFVKKEFMDRIKLESGSIFTNAEIGIKCYFLGARIKEVGMQFLGRTKGSAKGGRWSSLYKTFRDIFKHWFLWIVLGRIEKKSLKPIERLPSRGW